jgi:ketosteroid isomerase-like protein
MPQLPAVVGKALEVVNAGDTDAFIALFVPEAGFVDDWGREFRGAEAIRTWSDDEFIGKHVTLEVVASYLTGNGDVVVIVQVGGNGYTGPSTLTFRPQGELIANMRIFA